MSERESKTSKFSSGLIRGAIPASLLTTGIVLTFGYASGLVYSIGDTRQLTSIFGGIIFGSIIFSLVGFIIKSTKFNLISVTTLSVVLLAAAYVIIFQNSLVLGSTNLLIVSFLICSPAMAVSQLMARSSPSFSMGSRLVFGSIEAVLVIVFIFVYALEYEMQGQVNLYLGPLIFLLLSVVYLVTVKLV